MVNIDSTLFIVFSRKEKIVVVQQKSTGKIKDIRNDVNFNRKFRTAHKKFKVEKEKRTFQIYEKNFEFLQNKQNKNT